MSIRIKLLAPGLTAVLIAAAAALWPGALPTGAAVALIVMALALVALQALAHERWVMRGLYALQAALAGRAAPAVSERVWQEAVTRVSALQAASANQHSALERVATHSRQMEDALRLSEERYVTAVRGANDGLWEWDLAAQRVVFSPRWKHMFGLDNGLGDGSDSMSVEQWRERLHPDDREEAVAALDAHLHGLVDRYEHPHRLAHADGRYRWVLSRGTALRRASGQVYRMVGLDTDITQLKRVEGIVDAIARGTAGQTGEAFFKSLVQNFAHALHIECAFITECANRPATRTRTLAFWRAGVFDANFEYELAGTPCEHVICQDRVVFERENLAQTYPREKGLESYLGLPIHARDGGVIGHLAFLDTVPMRGDVMVESVYRIFTARAAAEIELGRALTRLDAMNAPPMAA